jgi:hypothetical protein
MIPFGLLTLEHNSDYIKADLHNFNKRMLKNAQDISIASRSASTQVSSEGRKRIISQLSNLSEGHRCDSRRSTPDSRRTPLHEGQDAGVSR